MSELRSHVINAFSRVEELKKVDDIERLSAGWLKNSALPEIAIRHKGGNQNSALDSAVPKLASSTSKETAGAEAEIYRQFGRVLLGSDETETLGALHLVFESLDHIFEKSNNDRGRVLVSVLANSMGDLESRQRGFLITGQNSFLTSFQTGQAELSRNIQALRRSIENAFDKEEMSARLANLDEKVLDWQDHALDEEISVRREINQSGLGALEFVRMSLVKGQGITILGDIEKILARMDRRFAKSNLIKGRLYISRIGKSFGDQSGGKRGFLVTGEKQFLDPYYEGRERFKKDYFDLSLYIKSTYLSPDKRKMIADLKHLNDKANLWQKESAEPEISERIRLQKTDENSLLDIQKRLRGGQGKAILDDIRGHLAHMSEEFSRAGYLSGIHLVNRLSKALVDQETGQRGYLITGDDEFLDPYRQGQSDFRSTIAEIRNMVANAYEKKLVLSEIKAIEGAIHQWLAVAGTPEIRLRRDIDEKNLSFLKIQETLRKGIGKGILDKNDARLDALGNIFLASKSHTARRLVMAISKDIGDMKTGQSEFLLTGQEAFLAPFVSGQSRLKIHVAELRTLVNSQYSKKGMIKNIESLRLKAGEWSEKSARPEISLRRKVNEFGATMNDVTALIENETGKNIIDSLRIELDAFVDAERELILVRTQAAEKAASLTIFYTLFGTVLFIIFALVSAFLVSSQIRSAMNKLLEGTKRVAEGDFSTVIDLKARDETGLLADSFNGMTLDLDKFQKTLKAQAEEMRLKNLELEKAR
ncbi:MAG: CHASE3 domain sensor protein [Candidatus Marinamargulisbacteria bacterium]|jgi:CHASE3 domain sensor protein